MHNIIIDVAAFIALFAVSMLFSASETAVVSLTPADLSGLKEKDDGKSRKLAGLIKKDPDFLMITLLLGNNLANVGIATLAALITKDLFSGGSFGTAALILDVIIVGLTLLFLGEIIPKSYSIRNKTSFISSYSFLILFFYYLLYPLSFFISRFVRIFMKKGKTRNGVTEFTRKDIENLMEVGGEDGALEEDEKNMITSIFEFSEKNAKEVMVPRVDMMAIPSGINREDLYAFINENSFSRIPVYKDNIDNIIGILYIKDLLQVNSPQSGDIDIESIVRDVTFIPESKDISNLLKMFQREKTHIAIVVDEYGGTSGLITLEDIIEEIVGEIQDEFDDEERLYRKVSDDCYEFDAKIPIDDLNEIININLPENEDYESLGGYLYELFGEVPETGARKSFDTFRFTILSLQKQRIGWVKIENIKETNENNDKKG